MTGTLHAIVPPKSLAELRAALPGILAAPKDGGRLDLIVSRPASGRRETPRRVGVSAADGIAGDHWAKGCWLTDDAGNPHPDVQICLMASPVIRAIAGEDPAAWAPAGDNLFFDMDLGPASMPPGTAFAIGSAAFVVTAEPHRGCSSFVTRYGRDAMVFVNTGPGREHCLRGIYARVTRDGEIAVGDRLRKIG